MFSLNSKIKSKVVEMANVFQVGEICSKLLPDYSLGSLFKRKGGNNSRKKTTSSLTDVERLFKMIHDISHIVDRLTTNLEQNPEQKRPDDKTTLNESMSIRILLQHLLAEAQKKDFTKDQILQRLNEIVYPERESSMQDSSRHNDAPYSARSPPQSKVNLGLGASHSNKQQTAACGNSKTSLYSDLLLRDRAEKKASKPQNSPLPSTPVNSNSKTPSAATNSTINYQFGPIKLIRWVKSKLFRTSNSHKSAKSNPSTSSKKRHLFKSGYKKTQADMLSELPLADRRAIEEEEMNHVMLPNSLEVTTLQQIKEKVDLQVGEFRKFLPDAVS